MYEAEAELGHVGLLDFLANYPVTKQLFPEKPSGVVTSPSLCSLLVLWMLVSGSVQHTDLCL